MDLRGAVALVTGASRGVGRAIALALADAGADVACAARATDVSPLKLPGTIDETVRSIEQRGRRGLAIPTDLSKPDQVEAMVARTISTFGRLDVLVNNAAITFPGDLELPIKRWDLVMDVNLRAPLLAMKAALPGMIARRRGAILNVSSAAAVMPIPGLLAYGVSKVGLERLTMGAGEELRAHGVAVNCLRIDIPLASEGFVYNAPELDKTDWQPTEVGADAAIWMLARPPTFNGHVKSLSELRREGDVARGRVAH
jgi:citronellol/citronellal dehydrogenase